MRTELEVGKMYVTANGGRVWIIQGKPDQLDPSIHNFLGALSTTGDFSPGAGLVLELYGPFGTCLGKMTATRDIVREDRASVDSDRHLMAYQHQVSGEVKYFTHIDIFGSVYSSKQWRRAKDLDHYFPGSDK